MVIEDPTLLHEEPDRISKNDAFWQPVTWAEQEKLKYPFTFVPLKDLMSHEEEKPALTQGISDKAKSLPDQPIETEQSKIKSGGEVGDTTQLLTATLPLDLPISSEEQIEARRYLAESMSRLPPYPPAYTFVEKPPAQNSVETTAGRRKSNMAAKASSSTYYNGGIVSVTHPSGHAGEGPADREASRKEGGQKHSFQKAKYTGRDRRPAFVLRCENCGLLSNDGEGFASPELKPMVWELMTDEEKLTFCMAFTHAERADMKRQGISFDAA